MPRQAVAVAYLAFLAVLAIMPNAQGQGWGSALLTHRHTELDELGRPAYLEASNTRSRKLYEATGYRDCAPPLNLPYQGEPMFPMWRAPSPRPGEETS
jgi:GNAT superfamily N-acetyltransferase